VFQRVGKSVVGMMPRCGGGGSSASGRGGGGGGSAIGFGGKENVEGANWFVRRDDEAAEGSCRGAVGEDGVGGFVFLAEDGEELGGCDDPGCAAFWADSFGGGGGCFIRGRHDD